MEVLLVQDYIDELKEHANTSKNHEVCGLLIDTGTTIRYIKCTNLSIDPESFIIKPEDYMAAESLGKVICICHSHITGSSEPSESDIISCNRGKVPWLIYSLEFNTTSVLWPNMLKIPILNRPYIFGVSDCGSIIQDIFRQEAGLELKRDTINLTSNWYNGNNFIPEWASENNFIELSKANYVAKYLDVLAFQFPNMKYPSHLGIMVGPDTFIHHIENRLSSKDRLNGYWLKHLSSIYRYNGELHVKKNNTSW